MGIVCINVHWLSLVQSSASSFQPSLYHYTVLKSWKRQRRIVFSSWVAWKVWIGYIIMLKKM